MSEENRIIIQREANEHRHELVLDMSGVVLLLGWTDSYEDDFYWVIGLNGGIILSSCVGGFIWLKGVLPDDSYDRLERQWFFPMGLDEYIKNAEIFARQDGFTIK